MEASDKPGAVHLHRNPDADDEQTDTDEEAQPLSEQDDQTKSAWFGFPRDGSYGTKYDDATDRHRLGLAIHSNKPGRIQFS